MPVMLSFRRLSGANHTLSVELSATIEGVKALLSADLSIPAETIFLVFKGRQLADDQTVESLQVGSNESIIMMQTKQPPAARPPPPKSSPNREPAPESRPSAHPVAAPERPSIQPLPGPFSPALNAAPAHGPDLPAFDGVITQLIELGFPPELCREAAILAGGDRERAAFMLMASEAEMPETSTEELIWTDDEVLDEEEETEDEPELTDVEMAQIAGLAELGFDREIVIRVFLMCDKDETLTANCLLAMREDR
jgi:hypothetical protein